MGRTVRIAVDAMGGEFGPATTMPALVKSLRRHQYVSALVFGDCDAINLALASLSSDDVHARLQIVHCTETISDDDKPSTVVRSKRDSSMGKAINALVTGDAEACISSGNTGALVAMGLIKLRTLPGITRPAICTTFPTAHGRTYVLDLGANLNSCPDQLHQFAVLGSLTAHLLDGKLSPELRLLNVGVEETKGGDHLQQTSRLLEADQGLNYCGFVEGDGIFSGQADVVVCDGFSGNIALKTTEGFARMIASILEVLVAKSWFARALATVTSRSFRDLRKHLDPSLYNGAYLLGLNGVVVKSHGSASVKGFGHALDVAVDAAKRNLPQRLTPLLEHKFGYKIEK